jgi:uncharacterized membrane protein YfcA
VAIAESMAIVGLIAVFGAVAAGLQRQIDWRSVLLFGLPGMVGSPVGAVIATYFSESQLMIFFSVILLMAGVWMFINAVQPIRPPDGEAVEGGLVGSSEGRRLHFRRWLIVFEGFGVGAITGIVGVGGGFLIVPALVLLNHLSMRIAVGTSFVVIAMKSMTGFAKQLQALNYLELTVDWNTIAWFVGIGFVGMMAGRGLAERINQRLLKQCFALFLVGMGIYIIVKEIPGMG